MGMPLLLDDNLTGTDHALHVDVDDNDDDDVGRQNLFISHHDDAHPPLRSSCYSTFIGRNSRR